MPTTKILGRVVLPLIAALAIAAPVSADGAIKTAIRIHVTFGVVAEPFTTTGGLLCPAGTAVTDSNMTAGGGTGVSFHVVKTLTCEDGTGTFRIMVDAGTSPQPSSQPVGGGGWRVIDGTGDYAGIRGGGHLEATGFPGGVDDLYTGNLQH